jgi:putative photosynthetic complex assembly protein
MSDTAAIRPFPLAPLVAAGTAIAITIVAACIGRLTGIANSADTSEPIASLDLRFEDRADGGVNIFDGSDGHTIEVVSSGTNGFLRATLRGLASQRKRESIGPEIPFRLTAWEDGRLTLEDPATRRTVDLGAFGQTNEAAFAQLLTAPDGTR